MPEDYVKIPGKLKTETWALIHREMSRTGKTQNEVINDLLSVWMFDLLSVPLHDADFDPDESKWMAQMIDDLAAMHLKGIQ